MDPLLSPLTPAAVRQLGRALAPLPLRSPTSARMNIVLDPHKGVAVVLLALLLWLGWLWAAAPHPPLGVLRLNLFRIGVLRDCSFFFMFVLLNPHFAPLQSLPWTGEWQSGP